MTVALVANASLAAAVPSVIEINASMLLRLQAELAAAIELSLELSLALPALKLSIDAALDLSAQLQANLAVDPSVTVAASLAYAADAQVALAAGLAGPSLSLELGAQLDAQLKAVADLSAEAALKADALAKVQLRIGLLKAAIDAVLTFNGKLEASAGIRVFLYEGTLASLSAELEAYLAGSVEARGGLGLGATVYAPIFVAEASASDGLKFLFGLT